MANYITQADLQTLISNTELIGFLDDRRTGLLDMTLLNSIISTCSTMVDGYLASIYTTPFPAPYPAKVRTATLYFTSEALYARRLTPEEKNPFKQVADMWRTILTEIGSGQVPLDANFPRAVTPGFSINTPSIVNDNMF